MSPLAALGVGAMGLTGTVAGLLAQVAESGSEVTPWATGGGIATLAAVLVYLFKQMLSGNLVSKPIAERIQEAQVVNAASMEREDRLMVALLAAGKREETYVKKIEDVNRVLFRAAEALRARPK